MGKQRSELDLSEPERRFNRRWRELVDEAGGPAKVSRLLGYSTTSASRYKLGHTLPGDYQVRQLCRHLKLGRAQEVTVLMLLEVARPAYYARKRGLDPGIATDVTATEDSVDGAVTGLVPEAVGPNEEPQHGQVLGERTRSRGRGRLVALASAALAVIVPAILVVVLRQPGHAPGATPRASGAPVARGSFPGMGIKTIPISGSLLTPTVAAAFRHSRTAGQRGIDGYAFRNMKNPGLCLTAVDTGPAAGENRDRVDVQACDYAANQVWIPEQWEADGSHFTQLVSFRYQSKCLNAQYIGGLANGHATQLWNCYQSPNEYWDFGDWYQHAKARQAYPIFVQSASLCLDADKYAFDDGGTGTPVNIWDQYPAANQFWS